MDGAIEINSQQDTEADVYDFALDNIKHLVEEYLSDSWSRGRLVEAVPVGEASRDSRRVEYLDTGFLRRTPTSPRRRRFAHPGSRFSNYCSSSYIPEYEPRGRSPRSRADHYSPPRSSFRPSSNYVPQPAPAELQLARAMADLDVKNEDREDRRDRGGNGGGRGRGGNNNRKRRYDGKIRACAVAIIELQLTNYAQTRTTPSTTAERIAVDHLISVVDTMTDRHRPVVATKSLLSRSFVVCC
jgi:hypothetical protein